MEWPAVPLSRAGDWCTYTPENHVNIDCVQPAHTVRRKSTFATSHDCTEPVLRLRYVVVE